MENSEEIPIPRASQSSNPFLEDIPNEAGEISDLLSSSYSEINFNCMMGFENRNQPNVEQNDARDSPKYDKMELDEDDDDDDECVDNEAAHKQRPNSLICDRNTTDKEMTHFVADNIEYMIKNSPVSKFDPTRGDSKNSTPSAPFKQLHGPGTSLQWVQKQQNAAPLIDSNILNDLEIESQYLASNVDNLTENLTNLLHSISSIAVENVECFKNSVTKLTEAMDCNIKSMYSIIAKTEEVSKSMKNAEALAARIRDIRRLVDLLEGLM